ncbi:MAG: HNH endonuclease [Faecalibacillus intestinalis]|uniref:HNH endonuclease n=1 Tax=Faecalibacillus intestinalis TaxID=1982626 RepID=UPI003994C27D
MQNRIENQKGEFWKEYKDGYFFSNFGRVKHIYKNGNARLLKPFMHNTGVFLIKIHCKSHAVSRIVYELFEGPIPEGYSILHKNRIRSDNSITNLKLATKNEVGRYSGFRTSRKKVVIYDATHDCYYRSTREAAKKLHISRQTVSDYCNMKVKKPMFDLSWERC